MCLIGWFFKFFFCRVSCPVWCATCVLCWEQSVWGGRNWQRQSWRRESCWSSLETSSRPEVSLPLSRQPGMQETSSHPPGKLTQIHLDTSRGKPHCTPPACLCTRLRLPVLPALLLHLSLGKEPVRAAPGVWPWTASRKRAARWQSSEPTRTEDGSICNLSFLFASSSDDIEIELHCFCTKH